MFPIRTILHPTDFSEHSDYAFRLASDLARDHGAKLHVLHVMPLPRLDYVEGVPIAYHELTGYKDKVEESFRHLKASEPKLSIHSEMVEGDPATEILQAAERISCDLIVVGTHGRTGLTRLLMGSVAERVLRKAACPVLTVKRPAPEIENAAPTSELAAAL